MVNRFLMLPILFITIFPLQSHEHYTIPAAITASAILYGASCAYAESINMPDVKDAMVTGLLCAWSLYGSVKFFSIAKKAQNESQLEGSLKLGMICSTLALVFGSLSGYFATNILTRNQ